MAKMTTTDPIISVEQQSFDPHSSVVWTVTMLRTGRANALDSGIVEALIATVEEAVAAGASVLILRSSGRAFSAGFDISNLEEESDATLLWRFVRLERLFMALSRTPILTLAVLDGPAVGAGADLAIACRARIGSHRSSFRFPGINFGAALGNRRLAHLIGRDKATAVLLSNRTLAASEAQDWGLLTWLAESTELDLAAQRFASDVAGLAAKHGRKALQATSDSELEAYASLAELVLSLSEPGLRQRMIDFARNRPG
jgi:enoyl-CoA hydratase/carnithine racemase